MALVGRMASKRDTDNNWAMGCLAASSHASTLFGEESQHDAPAYLHWILQRNKDQVGLHMYWQRKCAHTTLMGLTTDDDAAENEDDSCGRAPDEQ